MALIKCNECGKKISDTSKKCIHCGNPIIKEIICSECGIKINYEGKVCKNCGNKLINEKEKVDIKKKKIILIISIITIGIVGLIFLLIGNSRIDLNQVYKISGCDDYYCELADDGSYLEIDTNPLDIDNFSSSEAWKYVKKVSNEVGFTESTLKKMGHTTALDGTQSDENNKVKVSWTYHPDNGFEVTYSLK